MAINKNIREKLLSDTMIFDGHAYDNSIIGITLDGRAIYSFELMVRELMYDENWPEQEAIQWLQSNTLNRIPYFKANAPIVVYKAY